MIPYGIVIKQNRVVLQQSLMLWQRKFGILQKSEKGIFFLLTSVIFCDKIVVDEI